MRTAVKSSNRSAYGLCVIETDGVYYYVRIGSGPERCYSNYADALAEYQRYCAY